MPAQTNAGGPAARSANRSGEGSHSLLPHLERQAHAQIESMAAGTARDKVLKAHAEWELRRTVLAEAERKMIELLELYTRVGKDFPTEELRALKTARSECMGAFDALMTALDETAASALK